MKQINIVVFILTLFLYCCQTDKKSNIREVKIIKPFPVVLDTFGIENFIFSWDDELTWLTTAKYEIYHIGLTNDTIYLSPFINKPPPMTTLKPKKDGKGMEYQNPFASYFIDMESNREYKYWEDTKMEIRIDTLNKFANFYPVLITNISQDTTLIGAGSFVRIIMEAVDSTGNWKPIQERFRHACGFGLRSAILPPKESMITLAPIFEGEFKTRLRLSIGKNYSEPFTGFIHYRQFESKFGENGDYKDEYKKENQEKERTAKN